MAIVTPFGPNFSKTKTLSASQTTASVTLDATDVGTAATGGGANAIRIVNAGPNIAFVRWGTGVQTAVTTDMPLMAGTVEVFAKPATADTVAAICSSGQTATLYVTGGEGS